MNGQITLDEEVRMSGMLKVFLLASRVRSNERDAHRVGIPGKEWS